MVFSHSANKPEKLQLPATYLPPQSVACAIQALQLLEDELSEQLLEQAIGQLTIPGRYQQFQVNNRRVIVDVAHNPAAAQRLATMIAEEKESCRQVVGVLNMMSDKDIAGTLAPLKPLVDHWILPDIAELPRACKPQQLQTLLYNDGLKAEASSELSASPQAAITTALDIAAVDDLILVCGSFFLAGPGFGTTFRARRLNRSLELLLNLITSLVEEIV